MDPKRSEDDEEDSLSAGWGRGWLKARGLGVILVVLLALNVGVSLWSVNTMQAAARIDHESLVKTIDGLRIALIEENSQRRQEHLAIQSGLDKNACVFSLTPAERTEFRQSRDSWSRYCWWMQDEPRELRRRDRRSGEAPVLEPQYFTLPSPSLGGARQLERP